MVSVFCFLNQAQCFSKSAPRTLQHQWSAILAQVVRESQYKSILCASRSTKIFLVIRAQEKFGNHCSSSSRLSKITQKILISHHQSKSFIVIQMLNEYQKPLKSNSLQVFSNIYVRYFVMLLIMKAIVQRIRTRIPAYWSIPRAGYKSSMK